jgi:hypothetical protein
MAMLNNQRASLMPNRLAQPTSHVIFGRQVTWATLLGEAAAGASHVGSLAQKNLGCSMVFPRVLWKKNI